MKRAFLIITMALVCLPAWAGTWREDYNDGIEGTLFSMWVPKPDDIVTIVIKDGLLDMKILKPGGGVGFGIPTPFQKRLIDVEKWYELKDYTLKMRVKFVDLPQRGGIGTQGIELHVRVSRDTHESYQANFFAKAFNRANIATISKGVSVEPHRIQINELISKELPKPITTDVWYDLKVIAKGNDINFSINRDFEISITDKDNPFIKGSLEFMVDDSHVMIDYIEVSGPEVPDSRAGLVGVDPIAKLVTSWGKIKESR